MFKIKSLVVAMGTVLAVSTFPLAHAVDGVIKQDTHQIRQDKKELHQDIHKRNQDRRQLKQEIREGGKAGVARERHQLAHDNAEIRKDKAKLHKDKVQRRHDKQAAEKFFRELLKGLTSVPRVIVTDKLQSYGAATREILPSVEHRQHRYLNNRVENSHQPTRQRERRMRGFKSSGQAQQFLSAYGPIAQHFRPRRHRWSAPA